MDHGCLLSPNQIVLRAFFFPGQYIKLVVVSFVSQLFFYWHLFPREWLRCLANECRAAQVLFQTEDQFQSQYKCLLLSFNIVWKFQFAWCSRKDLKRGRNYCVMKTRKNFQRAFSGESGSPWSTHYCVVTKEEYRNLIELFLFRAGVSVEALRW